MKKTKQKFKSYTEFEEDQTASYPPPEYVVEPQPGDKGFALVKKALNKTVKILEPGIWSSK
jgi:hypothetical protein